MALTGDAPVNRHLWIKYWDICHLSGNLVAWEDAVGRLKKTLLDRSEEIGVKAAWLTTTLRRRLGEEQVFIPTKAELAETSSEDIRARMAESFAAGDAEPAPDAVAVALAVPAPAVYQNGRSRITPLEDRSAEEGDQEDPE